jgi:heme exporter protein C
MDGLKLNKSSESLSDSLQISDTIIKRFLLLLGLSAFFMFTGIVFMYYFTDPFPKGPGGFIVSGHPVFYMITQAFMTFTLFSIAFISSILYLYKRKQIFDLITLASVKVGILAGALTLLIGIFWSKVEWGYFWQWEPRQTMTLLMFLFYSGLVIFRSTVEDYEDKAKLTAVFAIAAFPTVPMTNAIVGSLHPPPQQTTFASLPFIGIILLFIGTLLMFVCLLYITYKLEQLYLDLDRKKYLILSTRH